MFSKLIFYLFVLKSAFGFGLRYPGDGDANLQNDYEYNHYLSGWVKLHNKPEDWLTARVNCHMEGAFLASPWSTDFTSAISNLMTNNLLYNEQENRYSDKIWSGVHSSFDEGVLKSVDGKQVISLQHDDLVPLEQCGVFRSYYIDYARCDIALPYICYRPGPSATPTTNPTDVISKTLKKLIPSPIELPLPDSAPSTEEGLLINSSKCGDESLGYQFAELTGHCYKFHNHAVHTWDLAKSACEEEGAYLAIVNSDEEVKVLKKIYAGKIYGAIYPDTAAIGFYKAGSSWNTLEGESIEKAGYAKWRPEAPHFTARLGFIARDGLLYGYTKDIRDMPFICEKPALTQENSATESTESKTTSTELEEEIVTTSDTELVTEDADESIERSYASTVRADKAIDSKWITESVPVAGDITDEAIESKWNTESVRGDGDEAIELKENTESDEISEYYGDDYYNDLLLNLFRSPVHRRPAVSTNLGFDLA